MDAIPAATETRLTFSRTGGPSSRVDRLFRAAPRFLLVAFAAALSISCVLLPQVASPESPRTTDHLPSGHFEQTTASAPIIRLMAGPMAATANNVTAELQVLLPLSPTDPRTNAALSPGVPVREDVIVRLQVTRGETGAALSDVVPTLDGELAIPLQAVGPGRFEQVMRFQHEGEYQLTFGLGVDQPVFQFAVEAAPITVLKSWLVEPQAQPEPSRVGYSTPIRYRVSKRNTGEPLTGLTDVAISVSSSTIRGDWERIIQPLEVEPGLYEARVVLPEPGTYSTTFQSWTAGLGANDAPAGRLVAVQG
jgi:hypothetical protein